MSDIICENPTLQSPLNRASKDKFILVLNLPQVLRRQSKNDPLLDIDPLQISVFGAVVPNITVPAIELRYGGQSTNYSSHSRPNYPPLSLKFVIDNDYKNYYVLFKWLNVLNTVRESIYGDEISPEQRPFKELLESGLNTEYQTDFSILGLNEYNQTSIEFIYHGAFITNLGGIDYSYRDNEQIETTAEFQYNQFSINKP